MLDFKVELAIWLKVTFIFEKTAGFKVIHTCGFFNFLNLYIVQNTQNINLRVF